MWRVIMKVLKQTETSLLGYSYQLCFESASSQPYSVECLKGGELHEVDYFKSKSAAIQFFGDSSVGLDLVGN